MKKPNEYKIKSIQDIIDCTNEDNLDDFLKDLKAYLSVSHVVRGMLNAKGNSDKLEKVMSDGFTWIDDGENNLTVRYKKS